MNSVFKMMNSAFEMMNSVLDLDDPKTFRDLSKPIGARICI